MAAAPARRRQRERVETARRGAALCAAAVALAVAGAPRAARAQSAARTPDPLGQVTQALDPETQGHRASDPLQSGAPVAGVHHVIVQLRNALAGWLTAAEREQLDAIDATGTVDGDARLLRYVAIDRGLRRFAPMALDAVVRGRDAERLRALPPVLDERAALAAARCPAVAAALRRRERIAVASAEEFARSLIQRGAGAAQPGAHEAPVPDERALAADRAVIAASDAASHGEVAGVSDAAWEASVAYGTDADRAVVVTAALDLVRELVATARGAPLVPAPIAPYPAVAFDPLLETATPAAQPASTTRGRRARARGRALPDVVVRTASGACMDDLRCLPL